MTLSLDSAGHRVRDVLDLPWAGDVPQRPLLDGLDWVFLPILWIIGALIGPTDAATARTAVAA
jgi:hypothetical protein